MDWLLISCIASGTLAIILGLILYANWRAERQAILQRLEPLNEFECEVVPWPTDFKVRHSVRVTERGQQDHA